MPVMKKLRFALLVAVISAIALPQFTAQAQNISFLNDYLDNVLIYSDGTLKQTEHLPLRSYVVSNNMIAYQDNSGNFKIFHNHYLSITMKQYFLSDDIVVWYDDYEKRLKAYYNKETYDLDDALATDTVNSVTMGENIVAFVDSQGYLNIFYDGETERICFNDRVKSIAAGRDIVAFVEEPVNNFQVYYYGDLSDLDSFEPVSYKAGDAFVAFVDANNYLKVFYNFKTETVSFYSPDFYETADELMVFGVQNYFKVWYRGAVYTLESYIPEDYKMNNNVVAWIDQLGNLKFFDGEKIETISYEKVNGFEIHGSTVKYWFGVNSEHVYNQGKTYKND
jgi:hypothetical protein